MSEPAPPILDANQSRVLKQLRIMTGVAIGVCALLPVAAVPFIQQHPTDNQNSANRAAIAVFVAFVVVGISRRMQAYKAYWQGDVVTPEGYRKGIWRYVGCVVLGHLAAASIGLWVGHPSAAIDLAIFAIGLLVFGFPNGKPMLPQPPQLGSK